MRLLSKTWWRPALASAAFTLLAGGASAQDSYPTRPVTVINPYAAGGPSDIIARALARRLAATFKQPVVVDNRPGAGGNIAAEALAKAPADGYLLYVGVDTTFTVNPYLYTRGSTKLSDVQTVMIVGSSGMLIGVTPKLGVKTLQEFIAAAKKEPMTFASGGNGSPGHLSQAQIAEATGAKLTHIPYKGNAPAVLAIVSGEVQGGTLATPGMLPQVKAGKIVPLAVTSPQRSPLLPDVPTVGESGFKSLDYEVNYVVMAPRGLPPQVAATLDQALRAAMADPELLQQFRQLDVVPDPMSAAAAQARLEAQSKTFERLVKSAGVSIN